MNEHIDFETYLTVSKNKFAISLFDKKKSEKLYENDLKFENICKSIDLKILDKFLEDNIFKIEKQIGKFVKNIYLVIDDNRIFHLNIGIRKKNYKKKINKNFLENTLTELKDLFKENYQHYKIMHLVVKNYIINGNYYSSFIDNLSSENLCLEVQFISIPDSLSDEIDKVLEKYQIKIIRYLNKTYILGCDPKKKFDLIILFNKIINGFNENEILIIPKNPKKTGFFEKFFQLFS